MWRAVPGPPDDVTKLGVEGQLLSPAWCGTDSSRTGTVQETESMLLRSDVQALPLKVF